MEIVGHFKGEIFKTNLQQFPRPDPAPDQKDLWPAVELRVQHLLIGLGGESKYVRNRVYRKNHPEADFPIFSFVLHLPCPKHLSGSGMFTKFRALAPNVNFTGSLPIVSSPLVSVQIPKTHKMKNFEIILNVGEDRANCIEIDEPKDFIVVDYEFL